MVILQAFGLREELQMQISPELSNGTFAIIMVRVQNLQNNFSLQQMPYLTRKIVNVDSSREPNL